MVFFKKLHTWLKTHLFCFGDYFDNFIKGEIQSGRFSSASEVIRAALRLFEQEENKRTELIKALKMGEQSETIENFDQKEFLNGLHSKYLKDEL